MLHLSGIASSAGADRGSAMTVEQQQLGSGTFARLARSHLTPAPDSPPYNCQRPAGVRVICDLLSGSCNSGKIETLAHLGVSVRTLGR